MKQTHLCLLAGQNLIGMYPGHRRMHMSRGSTRIFLKADFPELELLPYLGFTCKGIFDLVIEINQLIIRVGLTSLLLPLLPRQTILSLSMYCITPVLLR